jgi:hypothetical protein
MTSVGNWCAVDSLAIGFDDAVEAFLSLFISAGWHDLVAAR